MKRKRFYPKWVSAFRDLHGKARLRFRRKGTPDHYFIAEFGTPEFGVEYEACKAGKIDLIQKAIERTEPGMNFPTDSTPLRRLTPAQPPIGIIGGFKKMANREGVARAEVTTGPDGYPILGTSKRNQEWINIFGEPRCEYELVVFPQLNEE